MAPVPKKKHSRSRSNIRRGVKGLTLPTLVVCAHCGAKKYPHRRCPSCNK